MRVRPLRFLNSLSFCAALLAASLAASFARAATIRVPQDQPTIQAGIDAAVDGDLVLVAPGSYDEELVIADKTITLASEFYTSGDPALIEQTILNGQGTGVGSVIFVDDSVPGGQIVGFTIQNGNNGIDVKGFVEILNNRILRHVDAIDYTGGGGLVRGNLLELNTDDGIDLDRQVDVLIEDNVLRYNGEGIEIRLYDYTGPRVDFIVRENLFIGNEEDGIQIIDQPGKTTASSRFLLIERNTFKYNPIADIGLMDNGDSGEDLRAASILDPIHVLHNTFIGGSHAIAGGDNMVVVNNLFVDNSGIALKGVDGDSIASHNLFWRNGTDFQNSNVDVSSSLFEDSQLDADQRLRLGSPAIDAGTPYFQWQGETVLDLLPEDFSGAAPDLGRFEFEPGAGILFESRIAQGTDDAEEDTTGTVDLGSPQLELTGSSSAVGLRFDALPVPPAATILESYVQFRTSLAGPPAGATLTIGGESSGDAAPFSSGFAELSSRLPTQATVEWTPEEWLVDGEACEPQRSPDLSGVLQEIVDHPDWQPGSAIALLLSGTGERRAAAYESDPESAPLLHVRYSACGDDVAEAGEICDGFDLLGETCASQGFPTGSLACHADCSGFDTSGCGSCVDDADADGRCDASDNCPGVPNADQADADGDGSGDVCDPCPFDPADDADGDGLCAEVDNCPSSPNPGQDDADADGLGDACDACAGDPANDGDGDGICGDVDNCPVDPNPGQEDGDADGLGDACDGCFGEPDSDGDGVCDAADVCPDSFDPGQEDSDADGAGDLCDGCPFDPDDDLDADGICGDVDNCPADPNPFQEDGDGDGVGDVCDFGGQLEVRELRISSSTDDAEESSSGSVKLTSSDLEMTLDGSGAQTVGLRFAGLDLPQGATITSAYLQFQADEVSTGLASLLIEGHADDDAPAFAAVSGDVSSRPRTLGAVAWFPADWTAVGAAGPAQRTPDLSAIVQEIVDRSGWSPGGSLAFIVSGSGKRVAEAFDGQSVAAPLLHLEFSTTPDLDGDGVLNLVDNCPAVPNPDQQDADSDGAGDACDLCPLDAADDADGDGLCADVDACPADPANDADADGVCGDVDNCPADPNPLQEDGDGDGLGDACDVPGQLEVREFRILVGADDAEEGLSGGMKLTSSDLELILDKSGAQTVGLRFDAVDLPQGASISSAHLQFQVDEVSTGTASLLIQGEAADDAPVFTTGSGNLSSRPRTLGTVAWSPPDWNSRGEAGPDQRSPDLSAILQEIVGRPGWASGQALALLITGSGKRVAEALNGDAAGAPRLQVEFSTTPDLDGDGVLNLVDNCPSAPNAGQEDTDADGAGDACDPCPSDAANDADGDGLCADVDSCPADPDNDVDADGVCGDVDVCPSDFDPLQEDSDGDGVGDACQFAAREYRISSSNDDAEESGSGSVKLRSSDLEMTLEKSGTQTVGLRFTGVDLPQGANISAAYLQFQADETSAGLAELLIEGQAADDAPPFVNSSADVSGRPRTLGAVPWSPPDWNSVGEAGPAQRSPDLSAIVQEIVDRGGWVPGSSMVFIVTGSGKRVAEAFDGVSGAAPLLHVELAP